MSTQPIDYDALAAQHGGTAVIDYDALAAEHGGTAQAAQPSLADQAHAEMSAKPTGARQWLTDLESDLRYGGDQTIVGKALKKAGYQGAESLGGMEGTAGKMMVSPLTGPVFAAHGVAELASGNVKRGAGEILSGIGEAAEIPMNMAAPEEGEMAAEGANRVGKAVSSLTPSAMRDAAGVLFQEVKSKAGNFPVDIEAPGQAALQMKTLYERGAGYTPPSVVTRFLNRVTKPGGGPMTYEEARDFYSNATRLSTDEALKLTPKAKAALTQFTHALGDSIQTAADNAGVGAEHSQAMQDYASAMRYADRVDAAKKLAVQTLKRGSAVAATAVAGKKIWDAAE